MNSVEVKTAYPPIPKLPSIPISNDSSKLPGQPGQGRPKNSKDTEKRKTKKFSPQTGASLSIWAASAQDKINELLNPNFLEFYNKKNMRSLSNEEYSEAEITKTKVFFALDPFTNVTDEIVLNAFNNINNIESAKIYGQYKLFIKNVQNDINRQLTTDELKFTRAYFYEMVYYHQ